MGNIDTGPNNDWVTNPTNQHSESAQYQQNLRPLTPEIVVPMIPAPIYNARGGTHKYFTSQSTIGL